MLWDNSEQEKLRAVIAAGSRAFTQEELKALLNLGQKHKPAGFDARASVVRSMYEGKQEQLVRAALKVRYPKTHDRMPVNPINWMGLIVAQDAGVYDVSPERYLEDAKGDRIADDDERAAEFRWLLDEADLEGTCPEIENRALAARTLFGCVDWDQQKDVPRISIYWPEDVIVVCHMSAPDDLDRCVIFAHRMAGPDGVGGGSQWWRIFTRPWAELADGSPSFGPWSVHVMSAKGDALYGSDDARARVEGDLPVFVVQVGTPDGCVFVDVDHDLPSNISAANVSRSNRQYVEDMQGHTPVWYSGTKETNDIPWGPDVVTTVMPGETLNTLSMSPAFADLREGSKLSMRELAASRGNSPDAYTTEPGPPQSGVAKRVQNQAHERRLRRLAHSFKRFEERSLLPRLMAAHDAYSDRLPKFGDAVARMSPPAQPSYEEPESLMRRMGDALDRKLITPAQAASRALPEVYPTVDDAVKAGLSNELRPSAVAAVPGAPVSRFAQRLSEARTGLVPELESSDVPTVPDGKAVAPKPGA